MCEAFYIGKTIRTLRARIYEHTRDLEKGDTRNALVKHALEQPTHSQFGFMVLGQINISPRNGDWKNDLEILE